MLEFWFELPVVPIVCACPTFGCEVQWIVGMILWRGRERRAPRHSRGRGRGLHLRVALGALVRLGLCPIGYTIGAGWVATRHHRLPLG